MSSVASVRTHCPAGHPYAGDNLFIRRNGHRKCRTCHRERYKNKRSLYRLAHPEKEKLYDKLRDPAIVAARAKLRHAVATGVFLKPLVCQSCNQSASQLHGHHDDYSKPFDVEWLCSSCHGERHRKSAALPSPRSEAAKGAGK